MSELISNVADAIDKANAEWFRANDQEFDRLETMAMAALAAADVETLRAIIKAYDDALNGIGSKMRRPDGRWVPIAVIDMEMGYSAKNRHTG